ncbi:MAG: hypothetical protein RCG15_04170 [Candidatus Rickettsia vulgarisii]
MCTSLTVASKNEISTEKLWKKHGINWKQVETELKTKTTKNITRDPIEYLISKNQGKKFNDLPKSLRFFLLEEVYQKDAPEYKAYPRLIKNFNIQIPDEIKSEKTTSKTESPSQDILNNPEVKKAMKKFDIAINTTPVTKPRNNQVYK